MTSPRRIPANWVLTSTNDVVDGYNIVTNETFKGTMSQFNAMLAEGFTNETPYPSSGALTYYPDDVQVASDVLRQYNFTPANGHFMSFTRTINGQAVVAITAAPHAEDTVSFVDFTKPAMQPSAVEAELSIVGRSRIAHTGVLLGNFQEPGIALPADTNVVSFWQHATDNSADYVSGAGQYLTLVLQTAVPDSVFIGDWVSVVNANNAGVPVSVCNVANGAIRHISTDRLRITVASNDDATLASQNLSVQTPTPGTMRIEYFDNLLGASHGMGIRFSSSTATSAAAFTRMGGDLQMSGTLQGDQRITFASTAPATPIQVNGFAETRPNSRFRLENRVDEAAFYDSGTDSSGGQLMTARAVRTSVKPNAARNLYPRLYVRVPSGMTKRVAEIKSITKTGTTTATVVCDQPHGLVTGDTALIKGVRDQTNFASLTTPVSVTVVDSLTFTIVIGATVTATSNGGTVHISRNGFDQQNMIGAVVQNTAWDVETQRLTLTGLTSWSGLNIGDHVYAGGLHTGTAVAVAEGMWSVWSVSGTTLVLAPLFDAFGIRISPAPSTINTATGGTVILATSLRIHDLSVEDWTEHRVMLDGQGTNRLDKAIPFYGVGGSVGVSGAVSVTNSLATDGAGGLFVRAGIKSVTDIASAALTANNTSVAIANNFGNGFQIAIPVTAVSGTSPTLDVRIEESYDDGFNFVTLYDFQRITATGVYTSPILRASGRHIRIVRTVGGTTPSFTHSVLRNLLPFIQAEPQQRLLDRSVDLTTVGSATPVLFAGAANNQQLVVNMGAITTTAPSLQLQGSEDGVSFYDIGSPVVAVASGSVQITVPGCSCTFVRAVVKTAGVGATMGYVSVKSWS